MIDRAPHLHHFRITGPATRHVGIGLCGWLGRPAGGFLLLSERPKSVFP